MTGKEYKICASDSPEILASEVTELLSRGWQLYGHPFVGAQNGHPEAGPPICQAMVKGSLQRVLYAPAPLSGVAAVAAAGVGAASAGVKPGVAPALARPDRTVAAPQPKTPRVRPPRPVIKATPRSVAVFLALLFCGAFLGDALFFRSGLYAQFLEPLSTTGYVERVFYSEANRAPSGKKEVLVLGNSRIAEGFSAKIANEYKQDGYWFSNCAFLASTARAWYYFVRDIDPQRNRYAAIAIPIDDYNDNDPVEDPSDRTQEMWLVINRLRITDIVPFALSFKSWNWRFDVFAGSTLKGLAFQHDLQEFIEHPAKRLNDVRNYRLHGADWIYAYGGDSHSLAGLSVDWTHRRITFPPGMPGDLQSLLTRQILGEPPQKGVVRDFEAQWLGALADLYRGSRTRIILYQVPRNPAPRPTPLAHLPWTSVDQLRKRPWVTVIDRGVFEPLEKPELFFDYTHLNSAGRKLFSPMLAETIKASLK